MMTREKYLSLKLDVLRVIARDRGVIGGSKMRKAELIDHMLQMDAAEGAAADGPRSEGENAPTAKEAPKKRTGTRDSKSQEAAGSPDHKQKDPSAAAPSDDNGEKTRKIRKPVKSKQAEAAGGRPKRSAGPDAGETAGGRPKRSAGPDAGETAGGRPKRSARPDAAQAAGSRTKRSTGSKKRGRPAGSKQKEPVRGNMEAPAARSAEPEKAERAEPAAAGTAELKKSSLPPSLEAGRVPNQDSDSVFTAADVRRSDESEAADHTAAGADRTVKSDDGRPEAEKKPQETVRKSREASEAGKNQAAAPASGGNGQASFAEKDGRPLSKEGAEKAAAPRQAYADDTRNLPGEETKAEAVSLPRQGDREEPGAAPRQAAARENKDSSRQDAKEQPGAPGRQVVKEQSDAPERQDAKEEPGAPGRQLVKEQSDAPGRGDAKEEPGAPGRQVVKEQSDAPERQDAKEQPGAPGRQLVKEQSDAPERQDAKEQPGASASQEVKEESDSASRQEDLDRASPRQLYYPENASKARGVLELHPDGYGFLRSGKFQLGEEDVYVSPSQIRRFSLRTGDVIEGIKRENGTGDKNAALLFVSTVNGFKPDQARRRPSFESMTPVFPYERIRLEQPGGSTATRVVDLISPIGKGQRGMIVSPPKAGKTTLLKDIAKSILTGDPDAHLIILLVDERPEEVTDMRESVMGTNVEIIYSTFDEQPEHHMRVAEMVIERAKRLVEHHEDVIILLDSITRLTRAYNLLVPPSGRTLSGGLDPAALYAPKRFFGAARKMREGGSLTILATALVDTGSKMDDVVYEEFKGTGNMELILDRKLQERRIFPAIDITKSGTRREDLLLSPDELRAVYLMRRRMNGAKPEDAIENILNAFARSRSNEQVVESVLAKWE